MGEVVLFDAVSKRPPPEHRPTQRMPYETYVAYRQAEAAFGALYLGRPLDRQSLTNCPSANIVQQHWQTVGQLAETLLLEKSLSREQVLSLMLHASLDAVAP